MSRQPGDMKSRPPDRPNGNAPAGGPDHSWRWVLGALLAILVLIFLVTNVMAQEQPQSVNWGQFQNELEHGQIKKAQLNANTGAVTFTTTSGVTQQTQGPDDAVTDLNEVPTLLKYLGPNLSETSPTEPWHLGRRGTRAPVGLDGAPGPGPDGQHHFQRAEPVQGGHGRAASHDICRR